MWAEINFTLPPAAEARLFGGRGRSERGFRKTLAALNTKYVIGLPAAFFGYTDEGVANPAGDTTIGIGVTRNGLRLVATGSSACRLLEDRAGAIGAALMFESQAMIPMTSRSGEHAADFRPYTSPFYVQSLCVGKSTKDNFWFQAAKAVQDGSTWLKAADRKLPLTIGRSLMRQAVLLCNEGDDLEGSVGDLLARAVTGEQDWRETGLKFGQRLDVRVHAVGGHTYVPVGPVGHRLVLKDVEFTMKVALVGPWFVGRLKIEGRGQVQPSTRAWSQLEKAA